MQTLWQDVRYALRMLAKNPGFTAVAVLTLALGIGANTAMFSFLDAVLLRPLPYPRPERLVLLWTTIPARGAFVSGTTPPDFREWRRQSRSFEDMAAFQMGDANVSVGGGPAERVQSARISPGLFRVLGVRPALGRDFLEDEEEWGRHRVVLLSDGLWDRLFSRDSEVVGRTITIGGESFTVAGIMPRGMPFFDNVPPVDLWTPLAFAPGDNMNTRNNYFLFVVGRLRPGVSLAGAQSEMDVIAGRLESQILENQGVHVAVHALREEIVAGARTALMVLFAAVGFVLLVACVNVANLLLARGAAREREFAVRTALGASRGRLARQLLSEALPLAALGGLAGAFLASFALQSLQSLIPANLPRFNPIGLDVRVLVFCLGASLASAVLFALLPAFQASRFQLADALKEASRGSRGLRHTRVRDLLVVSELALAMILLVGAGLMLRSLAHLRGVDPGFVPERLLTFLLPVSETKYPQGPQWLAFLESAEQGLRPLPGVTNVGVTTRLPLGFGSGWGKNFTLEGRPAASLDQVANVEFQLVSPQYMQTIGARLKAGRLFDEHDSGDSQPIALVNEAFARRYLEGENPVGKTLWLQPPPELMPPAERAPERLAPRRVIIGVIGDIKNSALNRPAGPCVFAPLRQYKNEGWMYPVRIALRTSGDPLALAAAVRDQIRSLDRDQPVAEVFTMEQLIERSGSGSRFEALLLGGFAGLALVLAAVGIYGVVSYSVAQRTREIGVRCALGAGRREILSLILGHGARLIVAGMLLGLIGALGLTRFLSSLLFGVGAADPVTYAVVGATLSVAAIAACYVPARRATRIDPMVALRYE